MKFAINVLQVNTRRLTESDFRFTVIISRQRHDDISRRKALPSGKCIRSVFPSYRSAVVRQPPLALLSTVPER